MKNEKTNQTELKNNIMELVCQYYELYHKSVADYEEGDRIQYSGRVYDSDEMVNLVDAALEFWLTSGHYVAEFENG